MTVGQIRWIRGYRRISTFKTRPERDGMMISLVENQAVQAELLTDKGKLRQQVDLAVNKTLAIDVHTHVHPPAFK